MEGKGGGGGFVYRIQPSWLSCRQDCREQHGDPEGGPRERGGGADGGDQEAEGGAGSSAAADGPGRPGQLGPPGAGGAAHQAREDHPRAPQGPPQLADPERHHKPEEGGAGGAGQRYSPAAIANPRAPDPLVPGLEIFPENKKIYKVYSLYTVFFLFFHHILSILFY